MSKVIQQLKRHEGFRAKIYLCTSGFETIGYGYCISKNPLNLSNYEINQFRTKGITREVAETILKIHVAQIESTLIKEFTWFENLNEARKAVLINMAFNLGMKGLLGFKNTLQMIKLGDYAGAARNMLKSKWADQVKSRAIELAEQMSSGVFA